MTLNSSTPKTLGFVVCKQCLKVLLFVFFFFKLKGLSIWFLGNSSIYGAMKTKPTATYINETTNNVHMEIDKILDCVLHI